MNCGRKAAKFRKLCRFPIHNSADGVYNDYELLYLISENNDEAKDLFMNLWLYANGLATLIATNKIDIDDKEIIFRIVKMYKMLEKK